MEVYEKEYGPDNWVIESIRAAIRARRERPRTDGLTYMINQPIDGAAMTDEDAVENLLLIMIGGFDTSAALLSNALLYLSENPSERERLRSDPTLIDSATEEFLRFFSPVQNLGRNVTAETVLGGEELKPGDRVLLCWASANLDEEEFPEADQIILDRFPNRHQAFGLGTHRCAGSHLARAEFKISLGEILRRLPDYQVRREHAKRYPSIGSNNGWMSMPAAFTPGTKLSTGHV
jgi:cytochrome P450